MYSIPAPIIKTIFDHCDLPTAIIIARVTKRCSSIFKQYREEILERCEYVNVPNMFKHCSDDFIIIMSRHEFFDHNEAERCCGQMRYQLHTKMGYGKLYWYEINKELLREIYKNGEYEIICKCDHKFNAAELGIELNIPYPDTANGLHAAILLQNKEMINELQQRGNFYTYCVTGYYNLADNYKVECPHICINNSNDPLAAFNYIEKRGYIFEEYEYYLIENYEVLKLLIPRITTVNIYNIATKDYNALMLFYSKLLEFTTIDKIYSKFINNNLDFTRFLLQKHNDLKNNIYFNYSWRIPLIDLADLLDNKKMMLYFCREKDYTSMRALIRRNGRQWAQQFDDPFIKKYY